MHHSVKALASARCSPVQLALMYNCVIQDVASIITTVTATSSEMAAVMSLSRRSLASVCLRARTICGTSTALKMPPEMRLNTTCGICEPVWYAMAAMPVVPMAAASRICRSCPVRREAKVPAAMIMELRPMELIRQDPLPCGTAARIPKPRARAPGR